MAKVKNLTSKDRELLKAVARCGYVSLEQIREYLHIRDNRLNNLVRSGYLEFKEEVISKNKTASAYKIGERGKEYVKENVADIDNIYKASSIKHDNKLAEKYFSLSEEDKKCWMVEQDVRDKWGNPDIQKYSAPDAVIYKEVKEVVMDKEVVRKEIEVVEVTTRNYKDVDIEKKVNYVEELIEVPKEVISWERA